MALNSTVYKAELQVSDMDRHYYATHPLTLARHPSETEERLMVRLLAYALFADERLEFGKGLSQDDEPDLWQKDYTGDILLWIELGQPDETRVRKACGRARHVVVITYGGQAAEVWWSKSGAALARNKNLSVLDIPPETVQQLVGLSERSMRLQVLVQDGELQLMGEQSAVAVQPTKRLIAADN
jgi:uncharacterized protein YaeQ